MTFLQIDLYNSMVEKEGTETEEEAKKAYRSAREKSNDTEERTVDDKVSSALINRVGTSFPLFLFVNFLLLWFQAFTSKPR